MSIPIIRWNLFSGMSIKYRWRRKSIAPISGDWKD